MPCLCRPWCCCLVSISGLSPPSAFHVLCRLFLFLHILKIFSFLTKITITVGRVRLNRWSLLLPLAWIKGWNLWIILGLCQKWTGLWHLILIVLLVKSLRCRGSYLLVNQLYWWNWLSLGLTLKTLLILWVLTISVSVDDPTVD